MRYRILGVIQTHDAHGTPAPLLAALALRPGRVTAPGTLIDEVWAEVPPQDAPAALQALVGRPWSAACAAPSARTPSPPNPAATG